MENKTYYEDLQTRFLIDKQLTRMAQLNASIGKESTMEEKTEIKVKIKYCLEVIKETDLEFYKVICPTKEDEI